MNPTPENNQQFSLCYNGTTVDAMFKTIAREFVDITGIYIGKIKIASYYYNGMRDRKDPKKYRVASEMPTIKSYLGDYESEEECRVVCIKAAEKFFEQLLTNPK